MRVEGVRIGDIIDAGGEVRRDQRGDALEAEPDEPIIDWRPIGRIDWRPIGRASLADMRLSRSALAATS
jgi:hypothetical protein